MDLKKVEKMIELIQETDVTELEIEEEGVKIRIQRGHAPQVVMSHGNGAPQAYAPHHSHAASHAAFNNEAAGEEETAASKPSHQHFVRSPMVGTFYASSSPTSKPFVEIGQKVKAGEVLCIVEAMKMMNQIECDKDGTVASRLVENGMPVEFDQPLFVIE
ncbi:MAG TPA: acetyl-CoA carboxylase biotin carboxyl carrier protein [Gammaproteobacteria bacterium]|nr:acetyl-CoA carboxylase biotin carboxyl carrier protein [Gammaproteobacteria bacterium]